MAHATTAFPVALSIETLTASSPHRGHTKTVGSFFFTIRTTRRLLRPKTHYPLTCRSFRTIPIRYLPLVQHPSTKPFSKCVVAISHLTNPPTCGIIISARFLALDRGLVV